MATKAKTITNSEAEQSNIPQTQKKAPAPKKAPATKKESKPKMLEENSQEITSPGSAKEAEPEQKKQKITIAEELASNARQDVTGTIVEQTVKNEKSITEKKKPTTKKIESKLSETKIKPSKASAKSVANEQTDNIASSNETISTKSKEESRSDKNKANLYPKLADTRLQQLWFQFDELKVEALIITNPKNVRYLTNFSGENSALFLKKDKSLIFVTDKRYEKQIETELYAFDNFSKFIAEDVWAFIKKNKAFKGVSAIAFESDHLSYTDAVSIRNKIRPFKFKPAPELVERFTMPKAPEELNAIKKSTDLTLKVFQEALALVKSGVSERELAIEIGYIGRKMGAEASAFEPKVISGENTCYPWSLTSNRKIKKNDVIIFDFGFKVSGFVSRVARTVVFGKPTKEQSDTYKLLIEAWKNALKGISPGLNGTTADDMMRSLAKKAKKKDFMPRMLGHGIGLAVEELPYIEKGRNDQIIPDSAVLVLQPGIYEEEKYGMRIADIMRVTHYGGEAVSQPPEDIIQV